MIMNDHVVKSTVARVFRIVEHDFTELFSVFANPIDGLLANKTAVSILCFVDRVNAQIVIESAIVEKFD